MDPNRNGYAISRVTVGMQLDSEDLTAGNLEIDGIAIEDLNEITRMLNEIERFQKLGILACLNPETLINTTLQRFGPTPIF